MITALNELKLWMFSVIIWLLLGLTWAHALPAIEYTIPLICGDAVLLGLKYKDPKAAGTPVDFIVIQAGKAIEGIHELRSTKDGIFIGNTLCIPAKMTFCPEDNSKERTR
jgi:hypothetical protein